MTILNYFTEVIKLVASLLFCILVAGLFLQWKASTAMPTSPKTNKMHQNNAGSTNTYRDIDGKAAEIKQTRTGRCLLSLDGGGIRGFSQITILHEVSNRLRHDLRLEEPPRLCNYFDMIGGVGTGGWLAILVGRLGLTSPDAEKEFFEVVNRITSGQMDSDQLDSKIKTIIKRYTGDSETLMHDPKSPISHCKTFVGAVTAGNISYLIKFRSYEAREGANFNCPIWQAARATLAYPDLFPAMRIGPELSPKVYISGEIGWSNPSNEVIREFEAQWNDQSIACLTSVGTGNEGVIQLDTSAISSTLDIALERMATDCQRVAEEVAYRFQGQNNYFRLSVEQGFQHNRSDEPMSLGDVATHTKAYLRTARVTLLVDMLVASLLQTTEVFPWTTTRERFEQALGEYISNSQTYLNSMVVVDDIKLIAQEATSILRTIREATSNEEQWLKLAKSIDSHFSYIAHEIVPNLQEPSSKTFLWGTTKEYFIGLKNVHINVSRLMGLVVQQNWGIPTHQGLLSKWIIDLDDCFKKVQNTLISDMHNQLQQHHQDEQLKQLLAWLSPLELEQRHNDVRAKWSDGTGMWFINKPGFQSWSTSQNPKECRVLCGIGPPGAGKTVICSLTIEHLRNTVNDCKIGVAYVYCDYRDQTNQTILNLIGGLAKQLLKQTRALPSNILKIFKGKALEPITIDDTQQIFALLLGEFDSVFICIDALDECEPQTRRDLLQFLTVPTQTVLRLFLTGRDNVQIEILKSVANMSPELVMISADEEDIRICLAQKIALDPDPEAMDERLRKEIIEKIVSLSHGIFLLPILQIQAVLEHVTKRDRRLSLTTIPNELFDTYAVTVERIKQQQGTRCQMALSILAWVYLAKRQLHINELQYALAVKPGDTAFDKDGIPSERSLLECCLGLVVVEAETSTIRLTHFTLQEYLNEHWKEIFPSGHSDIVTTCLTYLSFDHLSEDWSKAIKTSPLIEYAASNIGHHLHKGGNPVLDQHTLPILCSQKHFQFLEAALEVTIYGWRSKDFKASALHWVAYFGITSIGRLLLASLDSVAINAKDIPLKRTALSYAAKNGHESMVQQLLSAKGIDVNSEDNDGHTPLIHASEKGYVAIVYMLLSTEDVDINSPDKHGHTALSYAVHEAHEAVVQMLLSSEGVDINFPNNKGWTPLTYAASEGLEKMVEMLLGTGNIDINFADKHGCTPLTYAAINGHKAIVWMLLNTAGVDTKSMDNSGWTALTYATNKGHEAIVQMLLGTEGVNINSADNSSQKSLICAANEGQEAIFRIILDTEGMNVNATDNDGWTPLTYAARRGHKAIVQMLLDTEGVDVNAADNDGWTPLTYAARRGHEEIVQMLLSIKGTNINPADNHGQTPLTYATNEGHKSIVQILLSTKGIDINSTDKYGRTALAYAANEGDEAIFQTLLCAQGVDVNLADNYGQTTLTHAARRGHEAIFQMLIDTEGIKFNSPDKCGRTPLSYAAGEGHKGIVQMLLGTEGIDANSADNDGWTPLAYAAEAGQRAIVSMLLGIEGVDADSKDHHKRTPLSQAAGSNHYFDYPSKYAATITQILLDQPTVDPDSKDIEGRTPLSYAAEVGNPIVVQLLLKQNVNLYYRDTTGQTAFSYAADCHQRAWHYDDQERYEAVMQLLLEHGAKDTCDLVQSTLSIPSSISKVEGQDLGCN